MRVESLLLKVVLSGPLTVVEEDLIEDKLPQDLLIERVLLKLQVKVVYDRLLFLKFSLMQGLARRSLLIWCLICGREGQILEVRVLHCLKGRKSLGGVIAKKLLQQVEGVGLYIGQDRRKICPSDILLAMANEIFQLRFLDLLIEMSWQVSEERDELSHLLR